jgi:hypothetical protein
VSRLNVFTLTAFSLVSPGGTVADGLWALRALMVLPTWPVFNWFDGALMGAAGGGALAGLNVVTVLRRQPGEGNGRKMHRPRHPIRARRARTP